MVSPAGTLGILEPWMHPQGEALDPRAFCSSSVSISSDSSFLSPLFCPFPSVFPSPLSQHSPYTVGVLFPRPEGV